MIDPTLPLTEQLPNGRELEAADLLERLDKAILGLEQHPDDIAVDEFAVAMKAKLLVARTKGRAGWQDYDRNDLWKMLRAHVQKGDVRDIANFCMFIWHVDGKGETLTGTITEARAQLAAPDGPRGYDAGVEAMREAVTKLLRQIGSHHNRDTQEFYETLAQEIEVLEPVSQ